MNPELFSQKCGYSFKSLHWSTDQSAGNSLSQFWGSKGAITLYQIFKNITKYLFCNIGFDLYQIFGNFFIVKMKLKEILVFAQQIQNALSCNWSFWELLPLPVLCFSGKKLRL